MDFNGFQKLITESTSYQIPGVKNIWGGGYELEVFKSPKHSEDSEKPQGIFIADKNEKSVALCFLNQDGSESEYLWVPNDAIALKDLDEEQHLLKFDPYKKWILKHENKDKVEDFLEDFADHIESSKLWGPDKMGRNAKDDVEMLMDIFDIPSPIKSFEVSGDNQWDAELEDGKVIEITKRNQDDLMSTFKIFPDKKDSSPVLTIKNQTSSPKTVFRLPNLGEIEMGEVLIGYNKQSPYVKYLIKKCLGLETSADQADLFDHFQKIAKEKGLKSDEVKTIMKLLEDFMDPKEITSFLPSR